MWSRSVLVVVATVVLGGSAASAQSVTTGAIRGRVVDAASRVPLGGIAVAASAGRDTRTTRTADDGTFALVDLVPGTYDVTFADGADRRVVRRGIRVVVLQTAYVQQAIDRTRTGELVIDAPGAAVDPGSAALRWVADRQRLDDVPRVGWTHDAVMGSAPTGLGDGHGVAFVGATSLDNRYVVNGLDTTSPRSGLTGTFVPLDLVDHLVVTTGGATAEHGRAIGGLVAAVTRTGTNELRGSVFAQVAPGALAAARREVTPDTGTLAVRHIGGVDAVLGFELGGPIVRDHAWFHVGFAPRRIQLDYTRTIQRRTDCRQRLADGSLSRCDPELADGVPDVDPATGQLIVEAVDTETRTQWSQTYATTARADVAVGAHRGMASAVVAPWHAELPELYGARSADRKTWGGTVDAAATWTSRLLADRLRVDAAIGYHRDWVHAAATDWVRDYVPRTILETWRFADLAGEGTESVAALAGCSDGAGDPYPLIENCPGIVSYAIDGPGSIGRYLEERRSARLEVSTSGTAGGRHDLRLGIAADDERSERSLRLSGGALRRRWAGAAEPFWVRQHAQLAMVEDADPRFADSCMLDGQAYRCQILAGVPGEPGGTDDAQSVALAAYASDRWQVRPDLVVEAGLRAEAQRLRHAERLRGNTDPVTGNRIPATALALPASVLPRLGVSYDPSGQGRARVFGHWGRYREAIGTEVVEAYFSRAVALSGSSSWLPQLRVDPGLRAGSVDAYVAGAEYEVVPGLAAGAAWQRRTLRRAVEDVWVDDAWTLVNPGFGRGAVVPRATRDHDALVVTLMGQPARRLTLLASYAYARTRGNYTGTLGYDHGGASATHTSRQLDEPALLVNATGPLPHDRPHYVKIDAAYELPVGPRSALVVGTRVRALSGTPVTARGGWPDRPFLLPRGALGRTPWATGFDLRLGVRIALAKGVAGELYVDVVNVADAQTVNAVEQQYPGREQFDTAWLPIVGGTYSDLIWLKEAETDGGDRRVARRNPGFGQPISRYRPRWMSFGARITF
jgi:hypothetical protein